MGRVLVLALLAMAAGAAAQGGQTAQQAFDAGEAAAAKAQWTVAADAYAAALRRMNARTRTAAVVRSRRAFALLQSGGKADDAESEAKAAVAQFGALGVTQDADLAEADLVLGALGRRAIDPPAAAAAYRAAATAAAGAERAAEVREARIGLALATMTSDPGAAVQATEAALNEPDFATLPKANQADLLSLRARAELNRGNAKAAAGFANKALALVGRDSVRVSINQVQIRGDAALIEAKLGDQEALRHDLTFSGAGHLPDNGWLNRQQGDLPLCGDDVHPDDMAVVQFAIADTGRVLGAAPVYASRPGPVGDTFARAVRDWRWSPDAVRKLDAFWRATVRIELRCVTRPAGIGLAEIFRDETQAWLATQGVTTDLADPTVKPDDVAATGPAAAVARAILTARSDAKPGPATDPEAALAAANAPAAIHAYVFWVTGGPLGRGSALNRLDREIALVEAKPDGARAAAWLRVQRALRSETTGDLRGARAQLAVVDALPVAALPTDDPVRTLALLHLAMIDRRSGNGAAADSRLTAAGVSADQCSLMDVQPMATNMTISSNTFPSEAMRWGFEGTVREAFDINADGSVAGVRTVLAYPPMVFGPATERAVRQFRFSIPTLGGKALGCAAHTQNVRFVMH